MTRAVLGGVATAKLTAGDTTLDTLEARFGTEDAPAPQDETATMPDSSSGTDGSDSTISLLIVTLVGIAILAGLLWYLANRKKGEVVVPPPTLLIAATICVGFLGWSQVVEAATFTIGGTPRYNTCVTTPGINCAEPDTLIGPTTVGTVTMPDSVPLGSTYNVSYTIRVTTSNNTLCNSPNVPCAAGNTITYVYENLLGPGLGNYGMHF